VDETAEQLRTIGESGSHPDGDKVTKDLQKRKLIAPKLVQRACKHREAG